jgi:SAM-dependent methyltransferase
MIESVGTQLCIDDKPIRNNDDLISVYRNRLEKFGFTSEALLYEEIGQHKAKLYQFADLINDFVISSDSLLDIGCGFGSLTPLLQPCNYFGIDPVPEFITEARRNHKQNCFECLRLDQCDETFDWCILLGVVNSIYEPQALLESSWNKCRKGLIVDFIDMRKYNGNLNRFYIKKCVDFFLNQDSSAIEIYPTNQIWAIIVAKKGYRESKSLERRWKINLRFRNKGGVKC